MMARPHRLMLFGVLLQLASGEGEFEVRFEVAKLGGGGSGRFTLRVHPDWAPLGAERFEELVEENYFADARFFRVVDNFMAQFGIAGDPGTDAKWKDALIEDDPQKASNTRGRVTFATGGPGTRTTQLFINFKDNSFLDAKGFSPFAEVVEGMDVVDKLYKGYGEGPPSGKGPDQEHIHTHGTKYLETQFPELSYIVRTEIVSQTAQQKNVPQTHVEHAAQGPPLRMILPVFLVIFVALGAAYLLLPRGRKREDAGPAGIANAELRSSQKAGAVPRRRGLDEFV